MQNWRKAETGQSLVEFAIILPILVLLLTLPVDFFRYVNTKMILSSAASESISRLNYASVSSGNAVNEIMQTINDYYGDRLDSSRVQISFNMGSLEDENYTYYVYSSAKANPDPSHYWDQFEDRPASYQCMEVQVQFSYELSPITYWGVLFLGSTFDVQTPAYTRNVYAGGYTP
ncbi:TadE/TadG family type IV pilus assembly protein [Petroclostridium sp. X23]|uniref:TadE/TadG family type IV pilus assembly protein n=1 Tax=Petroclostridium sp. X23 TaxID=3045146 RepID=UPI0024ACC843|nr:TadE/TadG family type IV pilus assembly protein [Petroclostridium sp. X23]WHH57945.1 TadE/TadG family type IV pilus assembly protein [Petroclostridium sp. X23]